MVTVNVVVEGITDEYIVRKILKSVGLTCGIVRGKNGKAYIERSLEKYNNAAKFSYWLVVMDLDTHECVVDFVKSQLPEPSDYMALRVAVREIESWLMADSEYLADYLSVPVENFPQNPDLEDDPKQKLISIVKAKCTKNDLRDDLIPSERSGRKVGIGYPSRVSEFVNQVEKSWRPDVAASNSESLRRCIRTLEKWKS